MYAGGVLPYYPSRSDKEQTRGAIWPQRSGRRNRRGCRRSCPFVHFGARAMEDIHGGYWYWSSLGDVAALAALGQVPGVALANSSRQGRRPEMEGRAGICSNKTLRFLNRTRRSLRMNRRRFARRHLTKRMRMKRMRRKLMESCKDHCDKK